MHDPSSALVRLKRPSAATVLLFGGMLCLALIGAVAALWIRHEREIRRLEAAIGQNGTWANTQPLFRTPWFDGPRRITWLELSFPSRFHDHDLDVLGPLLVQVPSVEEVILQGDINDAGLRHLADLPNLKHLMLGSPRLTAEGLRHVGELKRLESLSLKCSSIRGPGLEHLQGLTRLEDLDLGHSSIDDAGLAHLPPLPALRKINLCETNVSADAAAKWQSQLPHCVVVHSSLPSR